VEGTPGALESFRVDSATARRAGDGVGAWGNRFPGIPSSDIIVILEVSSGEIFIGCLDSMDEEHLSFDYLVMEDSLQAYINERGNVRLKTTTDLSENGELVPCRVVSDCWRGGATFSEIHIRRCKLKLLKPSTGNDTPRSPVI
jgi:hypothetical protein